MQWMEERAYENIKNTFGEEAAKEAKRYCEELKVEMVEGAPTVDAVPVVRCKECIHKPKELQYCCNFDMYTMDDFFCAQGERRKE